MYLSMFNMPYTEKSRVSATENFLSFALGVFNLVRFLINHNEVRPITLPILVFTECNIQTLMSISVGCLKALDLLLN
jgi:uncharacterized membrane protein